jgi:asparagine synthase (glutamine-hydrolysing)
MCGIAGILAMHGRRIPELDLRLRAMCDTIRHRGPDGEGYWTHDRDFVGFGHRRLSIIDLVTGDQPMHDEAGNWIVFNGEIYNYRELRAEVRQDAFRTQSDTEAILAGYRHWGREVVEHLRGMFAFAIWDETRHELFCARDRFGMKPFYYTVVDGSFYFASETKALLPFRGAIKTDLDALKDYLAFQCCLDGKTLFDGIKELPAAHTVVVARGKTEIHRYWDVRFDLDLARDQHYFEVGLRDRLIDSVQAHLVADVPVGAYVSGGLDSSIVASLAADAQPKHDFAAFTGTFDLGPEFDERSYARDLAAAKGIRLREIEIGVDDFERAIRSVIYHLDYPVAGPGAFPQYMVSRLAASERKVVLGGQGGDELFGGYVRYLVAYLEQCLKGAIDGTTNDGDFIVSYASILPNLTALRGYKPLLREFWSEGLFDDMDRRYYRLVNRAPQQGPEVHWELLGDYSPFETFRSIYRADNIVGESYFDRMTHFDFKALLPGLLQVEDRMSMAHGLESRLPFLDHPLVEFVATIPPNVKFKGGRLKRVLRAALGDVVPASISAREDKMGFPTPFNRWARGEARDFVHAVMTSERALSRDLFDNAIALERFESESAFGRSFWGLFSLELWQQTFHDRAGELRWTAPTTQLSTAAVAD